MARPEDICKGPTKRKRRGTTRRRVDGVVELDDAALNPGIGVTLFAQSDLHVHVPAGATPKDGPSAGVAMFIALMPLMTERAVPPTTAMTGETSLRGLDLPVCGIWETVIAAASAGIDTVMLPARYRRDVDDSPRSVRDRLKCVWLETVDDAVAATTGLGTVAPIVQGSNIAAR